MATKISEVADEAVGEQCGPNSDSDDFTPETATWQDFAVYETRVPYYAYKDENALHYLYQVEEWSQGRIGERYDVTQTTISRWMSEHGIETRGPSDSRETSTVLSVYPFKSGTTEYTQIYSRFGDERRQCYGHQLLACLENDPHEVFAHKNVIHHRVPSQVALDIPGNLEVLSRSEHTLLHSQEETPAEVAEVLDGDGTA